MEVTVVPSSSCYFAGEEATFDIIFTNVTTPSVVPRSHTHRRGHSISSAPLARPPTSPGVFGHKYAPSSPAVVAATAPLSSPVRRGIVGSSTNEHSPSNTRPNRATPKPLPSSLSRSDVVQLVLGNTASSKSRGDVSTNPFPIHHPHARKQSVQWNTIESAPSTANPSSYSLQLAPISESHSPIIPSTPPVPSPAPSSLSNPKGNTPGNGARPLSRGLGIDFPSIPRTNEKPGPRSASAGTLPIQGAETLLWAYAQVMGSIEMDTKTTNPVVLASIKSKLTRSGPVGAGRMDLHDQTPSSNRNVESSWSTFLGLKSPRVVSPVPASFFSGLFSSRSSPAVNVASDVNAEDIPMLVPSQVMLAVDLTLAPGESKAYTYSMTLPRALPPTYRGRSFRISYSLVVGTCRGNSAGIDSQSRLLRIPIRVYNAVSVRVPSVRYNLLWPSVHPGKTRATASVKDAPPKPAIGAKNNTLNPMTGSGLVGFGRDLLGNEPWAENTGVRTREDMIDHDSGDESRLAVEILTRHAKTASFDVHRGGTSVASLMLPKTTLRLGETVQGVVTFNKSQQGVRVAKLDCFLETYENLPEPLMVAPAKRVGSRRVQSEQHNDMVFHLQRAYFSLDIPSDASPGFGIHIADEEKAGGLEWRLRMCFLVCDDSDNMDSVGPDGEWGNSFSAGDGSRLGQLETVECEIPISVLPAHTVFGSMPVSFSV
ncbi:hypothetical protein FRC14_008246 [Serendipita sp. 396]|nr:hypothetical protein FRC14_008246 [Serendipita sp. 396]KAG8786264.1 hypothetical protein FRC15_011761 [Serendipita sp. 397]KAG8801537.1 hypothetical protein FRC16_000269 [Serendipita sp. 398]KAG8870255.1 hypothetical protein FRC20_000172 [Serendipita sp. 405]KAG9056045.1 hypothetical protein FS842_000437 [Serendipita sp. 407]